jgi:hypothetical protein
MLTSPSAGGTPRRMYQKLFLILRKFILKFTCSKGSYLYKNNAVNITIFKCIMVNSFLALKDRTHKRYFSCIKGQISKLLNFIFPLVSRPLKTVELKILEFFFPDCIDRPQGHHVSIYL